MVLTTTSISLFELAVEAAVNIPFTEIDEFFLNRGQLVPDDLIVKCANATLPRLDSIIALSPNEPEPDQCQCKLFRNISQSGFAIFATWSCRIHGSGGVQVKWCQKRISSFDCNCSQKINNEVPFLCLHAAALIKRRVQKCPGDMISQLAPLTNILMDLNEEQLREVLFEVASWDTSGKDLFDFDLGFDDPIEGIPDITLDSQVRGSLWLPHSEGIFFDIHISVSKIVLASLADPDSADLIESARNLILSQIRKHSTANLTPREKLRHLYMLILALQVFLSFSFFIGRREIEVFLEVPLEDMDLAQAMNLVCKFDARLEQGDVKSLEQILAKSVTNGCERILDHEAAIPFDQIFSEFRSNLSILAEIPTSVIVTGKMCPLTSIRYYFEFYFSAVQRIFSLFKDGILQSTPNPSPLLISLSTHELSLVLDLFRQKCSFSKSDLDTLEKILFPYFKGDLESSLSNLEIS